MRLGFVITDDWEIRGDGGGDPASMLFRPAQFLMETLERHGGRYTIMAEVMHYLIMRQSDAADFAEDCARWEQTVVRAIQRGHDVQLHLHPQWLEASYDGGRWRLGETWSLPSYPPETIRRLVVQGIELLEALCQPHKADYRCHSFRSGGWYMTPSDPIVEILADCGIDTDVSVVEGVQSDRKGGAFDYRDLDEGFAPYWASSRDVRRRADAGQKARFLEIPTQSRLENRSYILRSAWSRARQMFEQRPDRSLPPSGSLRDGEEGRGDMTPQVSAPSPVSRWGRRLSRWTGLGNVAPSSVIFDISLLELWQMKWCAQGVFERAQRRYGDADGLLPVIVECHSKALPQDDRLEHFLTWLEETYGDQVCFMTLSQAADHVRACPELMNERGRR